MAETQFQGDQTPAEPVGHVIGFVETRAECDDVINTWLSMGVARDRILMLGGDDGLERFHAMMDNSQWGEESQRLLKEGDQELAEGHYVICVEAPQRADALRIAKAAQSQGGHGFAHFGRLVDERFTR